MQSICKSAPSFGLLFSLLVSVVLCSVAVAQDAKLRPVARLITSKPTYNRPRRVNDESAKVTAHSRTANSPSLEEANPIERRAFEQTNRERISNGLPPLEWDADLCRMARTHSENMAKLGYLSHVTPGGLRLRDRARAVGITHYAVAGENIAYNFGYDDPGGFAVERWMISPGHRANILAADFKAMAVGTSVAPDGSVFLTQTFITR